MVRNVVGEVVGNPSLLTEHQEVGGFTSTGLWGAAVSLHGLRIHRIPFFLTAAEEQASEYFTKHTVVVLYHLVTL